MDAKELRTEMRRERRRQSLRSLIVVFVVIPILVLGALFAMYWLGVGPGPEYGVQDR